MRSPARQEQVDGREDESVLNLEVGPSTQGILRGLGMKDLRDLNDLTIHDVKPISDE